MDRAIKDSMRMAVVFEKYLPKTFKGLKVVNGDDTDTLQNVGGEYTYMLGGAELEGAVNYNMDSEEFTPSVTVGFSF